MPSDTVANRGRGWTTARTLLGCAMAFLGLLNALSGMIEGGVAGIVVFVFGVSVFLWSVAIALGIPTAYKIGIYGLPVFTFINALGFILIGWVGAAISGTVIFGLFWAWLYLVRSTFREAVVR